MMILTRWMARRRAEEKTSTFVFYTFFVQAIAGWLACVVVPGSFRPMSGTQIALIVAMGALALAGHFRDHARLPKTARLGVAIIVATVLYSVQREGT